MVGLAAGAVGLVLAYRYKVRYAVPAAGVVLNAVALAVWPTAAGFFRGNEGYHFRIDDRSLALNKELRFLFIPVLHKPFDNAKVGEEFEIQVDGVTVYRLVAVATNDPTYPVRLREPRYRQYDTPLAFRVPQGRHEITLLRGGKVVYTKQHNSGDMIGEVPFMFD